MPRPTICPCFRPSLALSMLFVPVGTLCLAQAASAQIVPSVCVEYPSAAPNVGVNYVARFSYVNTNGSSTFVPSGSVENFLTPVRPAGPEVFVSGSDQNVVEVLVPLGQNETWHLSMSSVTAYPASAQSSTITASPVCPIALRPQTLSYTSAGTYNNVLLAQVNSGPNAARVDSSANAVSPLAFSTSPAITVSNLKYVPGDTASTATTRFGKPVVNPNSVYGTITVAAGAPPVSQIVLDFQVNGESRAGVQVPLIFTPPAYTISALAQNATQVGAGLTVASGNVLPISVLFSYSGAVQPTGAITIQVDGSGTGLSNQSCTFKPGASSSHQNCTLAYAASGDAVTHTLTFTQAGDSNYSAFSGSANIAVTTASASNSVRPN